MLLIQTTYPNKPRDLKRFILGMIKSWLASCVQRIQYVKSYYLWEWQLKQEEEKILLIKTSEEKKEKLIAYIEKQHPYDTPEILTIKPSEVNEAYEKRVNSDKK